MLPIFLIMFKTIYHTILLSPFDIPYHLEQ